MPQSGLSIRLWQRMADTILARPGLILVVVVTALSPFAMAGWSVPVTYNLLDELDDHRPSVRGTELVRRHFPAGETSPITILCTRPQFQFDSAAGRKAIEELTKQLYTLAPDEIRSVRSFTEPLGDPPGYRSLWTVRGRELRIAREHPRTRRTYISQVGDWSGQVTRFDVVTVYDPFSVEAAHVLDRVETRLLELSSEKGGPWEGAQFDFLGTTAGTRDLRSVTSSDQILIQRLVTIAVLGVLLVLLRRPFVCLYLIASVLFSYLVTIGITRLVFGAVFPDAEGLDWKVPIFLFVILVAVGEDYNIYFVTRAFEEQRRRGLKPGLREAIVRTGGIITSCGLIMAGTFVSMASSSLRGMIELGFALTLGILLDTFVVRTILVPAFLALAEQRNAAHASANQPLVAEEEAGVAPHAAEAQRRASLSS